MEVNSNHISIETKIDDLAIAHTVNRFKGKKKFSPHIPLRLMNDKNIKHGVKVLFGMLYDYATAKGDGDYPEVVITAQYLGEQLNRGRQTIWRVRRQIIRTHALIS